MTAIQNGGLALFPVIIGAISTKTNNDYSTVEWFFVALAALGLVVAITLNIVDYRNGSILNLCVPTLTHAGVPRVATPNAVR